MNNFKKLYTADTLKTNKVVTVVTLPMEESIMFPIAQAIDLMKQGENILYFSFNHDSIKVNNFLQSALKGEEKPETITGNIAIMDAHQIPQGMDWLKFVEDTIIQVKGECELNYVFMDVLEFAKNHPVRPASDELVVSSATLLAFTQKVTPIIIKQVDAPNVAINNPQEARKSLDEFMSMDLVDSLSKPTSTLVEQSDYIIGVQRENKNFWKKVINFLLFWRKRNNFTIKVIKNRHGKPGASYRMNLDMDNFKAEVL
jgi:hypothetical protein